MMLPIANQSPPGLLRQLGILSLLLLRPRRFDMLLFRRLSITIWRVLSDLRQRSTWLRRRSRTWSWWEDSHTLGWLTVFFIYDKFKYIYCNAFSFLICLLDHQYLLVVGGTQVSDRVELISLDPASHPVPDCLRNLNPFPTNVHGGAGAVLNSGT
jgi:hypothetical protein